MRRFQSLRWGICSYWVATSGNVTDEMRVEYTKNQTPSEPDDNFNVTSVRSLSVRGGLIRL